MKSRIPQAIGAFRALLHDESLAAEASVRIGYLELRRGRWSAALEHFAIARNTSKDGVLTAAADYFAGWVHEQEGRMDAAIDAYRRALTPDGTRRNVALRLAALLFLQNNRSEAYDILDRAFNAAVAAPDLLVAIERADLRVDPLDPVTYAACGAFLIAACALALWVPARRAARSGRRLADLLR